MTAPGSPSHGVTAPGFRPDIQGMRALAVLIVVLYHIDLVPGGYVGVDVFFVISGFLMGGLLLREARETGGVSLRTFFTRRSRRLLPALGVTSVVTLVLAAVIIPVGAGFGTAARTGRAASLFFATLSILDASDDYFAPGAEKNPFLHTWSLSVEEQFYFALPLLIAVVFFLLRRRRIAATRATCVALAAASTASLALSIGITNHNWVPWNIENPLQFAFFTPLTRIWEFAAGVLLAAWNSRPRTGPAPSIRRGEAIREFCSRRSATEASAAVGLIAIVLTSALLDDRAAFPGYASLAPVLGTVLLLHAAPRTRAVAALLSWRPAVRLGDLSYGWYLWHWPLIVFCRALWGDGVLVLAATALASLGVAGLSYRFVEEPIRRSRSVVGLRALGLALLCIVVPAALSTIGLRINSREQAEITDRYATRRDMRAPLPASADGSRPHVVLVGDSHAIALSSGLSEVLADADLRLTGRARLGCLMLIDVAYNPRVCGPWQDETLRALLEERPDVVVLASYTIGRTTGINSGDEVGITLAERSGRMARTETEALGLYRTGLEALIDQLTGAGIKVIIVSAVPDFKTTPFGEVSLVDALRGRTAPQSERLTIDEVRARTGGVLAVDEEVTRTRPMVRVVDPVPVLCSDVCEQVAGGVLLYRDHDHVSHTGSLRLAGAIMPVIMELIEGTP